MILDGEATAEQIGAYLMLLRFKEETAGEVAGMVEAARRRLAKPDTHTHAELDWSSYAGKRRHLPWYILSAQLLAGAGVRVLMHGEPGHTEGRVYSADALKQLELPTASDLTQASEQLNQHHFSYIPLSQFAPELHRLMGLKPIFGLRNPVHTVARLLNPLRAPHVLQGIFHSSFLDTHQDAGALLADAHYAVFRGEGGEVERKPEKPLTVRLSGLEPSQSEKWPQLIKAPAAPPTLTLSHLAAVWSGTQQDEYAEAAICGTAAVALRLCRRVEGIAEADEMAKTLWTERNKTRF